MKQLLSILIILFAVSSAAFAQSPLELEAQEVISANGCLQAGIEETILEGDGIATYYPVVCGGQFLLLRQYRELGQNAHYSFVAWFSMAIIKPDPIFSVNENTGLLA